MFQNACSKMDKTVPKTGQKVHNGMKNSSPSTASYDLALTDFVNQELRSLVAAGLTSPESDLAECGHHRVLPECNFTDVTGCKRNHVPKPSKGGIRRSRQTPSSQQQVATVVNNGGEGAEGEDQLWKDPFGASMLPEGTDPVTFARAGARTKQCARRSTSTQFGKSRSWTPKRKPSRGNGSSGSSSDRSRTRLWRKGAEQDTRQAEVKGAEAAKPKQTGDDDWKTDSDSSDGEGRDTPPAGAARKSPVYPLPITGRFNGRIHPTSTEGACGINALLASMTHLALAHGYEYDIPENEEELRRVLVDYVRQNLDRVSRKRVLPRESRCGRTREHAVPRLGQHAALVCQQC